MNSQRNPLTAQRLPSERKRGKGERDGGIPALYSVNTIMPSRLQFPSSLGLFYFGIKWPRDIVLPRDLSRADVRARPAYKNARLKSAYFVT